MNSLRHIPLHMLMLAGLVGPLVAQENESAPQAPVAKVKPAASAYAGIQSYSRDGTRSTWSKF